MKSCLAVIGGLVLFTFAALIGLGLLASRGLINIPLVSERLNQAAMSASESEASFIIKDLQRAELLAHSMQGRFATTQELQGMDILSAKLFSGPNLSNDAYRFNIKVYNEGFIIDARPQRYGVTGRLSFYSDETLVIRFETANAPATSSSPEFGVANQPKR